MLQGQGWDIQGIFFVYIIFVTPPSHEVSELNKKLCYARIVQMKKYIYILSAKGKYSSQVDGYTMQIMYQKT